MSSRASRTCEISLLRKWDAVVGIDEVGRGALAGPVAVGAAMVDRKTGAPPAGLADSKLLSGSRRQDLIAPIGKWVTASAVGWASPIEVSEFGLTAALRLAGLRALGVLGLVRSLPRNVCVLLDGNHDWLSAADLFSEQAGPNWPVVTQTKADRDCSVVAAASVLAKVARDNYMIGIADPGYDWARNKGYASRSHLDALASLGASHRHRIGWKLPGVAQTSDRFKEKK